jgi:Kef-type K+ transport system membrane component KefB
MFGQLALLVAAGLLGPLFAAGRKALAPVLVGELVAGAILGRTGFGIIDSTVQPLPAFSSIGFAMLMLAAGTEVDMRSPALRKGVARGALALGVGVVAAIPLAALMATGLGAGHVPLLAVLVVGSSAAVAFPIIEERGLTGPAVVLLIGWITLADASTALVMPLTLTGPGRIPAALAGDLAIVVVGALVIFIGSRLAGRHVIEEARDQSIRRGWALQLRVSVLLLLILAAIADRTGASLLVAGFTAGIVLRRFREPTRVTLQLSGLANGFFVPAFFVLLGATLDLRALVTEPAAILLAVAMGAASVIVHLAGALVAGREMRVASGLVASAQLGLPAAAASLGLGEHVLSPGIAAALVAGGVLTLVPATIGAAMLGTGAAGREKPASHRTAPR